MFDAVNLKAVAVIPAHDSPLAALTFNSTGTKLASASATVSVSLVSIIIICTFSHLCCKQHIVNSLLLSAT